MSTAASASRALLRRQHQPLRRLQLRQQARRTYADSTTEKAKEAASTATSKASEGLSKVTSSAGPMLSRAASGAGNALNSIGGRTGRLIAFVQSANSTAGAAQSAAQMSPESAIQTVRNVDRASLARGGVLLAEILGFFTVGEMIGRFKIIGYRGEVHHEH